MILASALGQENLTLAKTLGFLSTIVGVGFALGEKVLPWGGGVAINCSLHIKPNQIFKKGKGGISGARLLNQLEDQGGQDLSLIRRSHIPQLF